MVAVLGAVLVVTVVVLWFGFFNKQTVSQPAAPSLLGVPKKVELKLDVLESDSLKMLGQPAVSAPLPSTVGRPNPFAPFDQKTARPRR